MTVFRKLTEEEQAQLGLSNLDVLLSTRASESTLQAVLAAISSSNPEGGALNQEATQLLVKACLDVIKTDTAKLDVNLSTVSTEATLALLKGVTDIIKLNTDNLDAALSTRATEDTLIEVRDKIESKFGDTPNKSTIAISDTSANILTANALRKEAYVVNNTAQTIWVCFGSPAVFNQGIKLVSGAIWIEDVYRGLVSAIMDTGQSGNIQVTDVLE